MTDNPKQDEPPKAPTPEEIAQAEAAERDSYISAAPIDSTSPEPPKGDEAPPAEPSDDDAEPSDGATDDDDDAGGADQGDDNADDEGDSDDDRKADGELPEGARKRLERERSRRRRAEEKFDKLEAELAEIKKQLANRDKATDDDADDDADDDDAPQPDQFDTHREYRRALEEHRQKKADAKQKDDKPEGPQLSEQEIATINKALVKMGDQAQRAKEADGRLFPQHIVEQIAESEVAPRLTAYILDNPDKGLELAELSGRKLYREIEKVEAKLMDRAPKKRKSSAPDPIKPGGRNDQPAAYDPKRETYAEFEARREREEAAKPRRPWE